MNIISDPDLSYEEQIQDYIDIESEMPWWPEVFKNLLVIEEPLYSVFSFFMRSIWRNL